MNKLGPVILGALIGATIYHIIQKRRGVFDTASKIEMMKDDSRIALHKYLDKLTEGAVDEKEIEDRVNKIIQ